MRQAKGIATIALGILLALMVGAPARAQVPCSTVCSRYDQGQCVQYTHYSCEGAAPSAPSRSYGAIAYGLTSGAWGTSYHWGSQAKAESSAMQRCAEHGKDCEVIVWFESKCGAVALGQGTTAFWGLGDSEKQARADAQNKCVTGGGKNCEVEVYECSK
jgi:hypothetical protein